MTTETLFLSVSLSPSVGVAFRWEGRPDFHNIVPCANKKDARKVAKAIETLRKMPLGEPRREWAESNCGELVGKVIDVCRALRDTREGVEKRGNEFVLEFRI